MANSKEMRTLFPLPYLIEKYEPVSLVGPAPYIPLGALQAEVLLSFPITNKPRILELGAGTGNATLGFQRGFEYENPSAHIITIDLNEAAATIARYKLNPAVPGRNQGGTAGNFLATYISDYRQQQEKITGKKLPAIIIDYEVRKRYAHIRNDSIMHRVNGYAQPRITVGDIEQLPFSDGVFDSAFAVQVLHWTDPDQTLSQVRRIIKLGSYFVFDSSGFQYTWGDTIHQGKLVDSYHYTSHPFYQLFMEKLNLVLSQNALPSVSMQELQRFHIFDYEHINQLAEKNGFKSVPLHQKIGRLIVSKLAREHKALAAAEYIEGNGQNVQGVLQKRTADNLTDLIYSGAQLTFFDSHPVLRDLNDEYKNGLIDESYRQAITEGPELLQEPHAETVPFFILKAV